MPQITLTLEGKIPSKKNSKRILKAGDRRFIAASSDYMRWEKWAVATLSRQTVVRNVERTEQVIIDFTFADKRRCDLTNKAEGIMDALVKAGILQDDCWRVVPILVLTAKKDTEFFARITIYNSAE